jgi:hypothetical protein
MYGRLLFPRRISTCCQRPRRRGAAAAEEGAGGGAREGPASGGEAEPRRRRAEERGGPAVDSHRQCCGSESGSGSTCFWASWIRIRIHQSEVWIRIRIWILLSPSKKSKKNLFSFCFVTSFCTYMYLQEVKRKKLFF